MEATISINTNLLKSKMALKGYSRKDLASQSGVSIHTINSLFRKQSNPSCALIEDVSLALELTPTEIAEIFFVNHLRNMQVFGHEEYSKAAVTNTV